MLRKMTVLAAAGVGCVLGARRAGRGRCEKVQDLAPEPAERPEVQQAVDGAEPGAETAATTVSQNVPGVGGGGNAEADSTGRRRIDGTSGVPVKEYGPPAGGQPSGSSSDEGSSLPPRGTFDPVRGIF